jgi:hypothetical protein
MKAFGGGAACCATALEAKGTMNVVAMIVAAMMEEWMLDLWMIDVRMKASRYQLKDAPYE